MSAFRNGPFVQTGVVSMRVVGVTSLVEGEMPGILDRKFMNFTKCSESAQRLEGDARSQILGFQSSYLTRGPPYRCWGAHSPSMDVQVTLGDINNLNSISVILRCLKALRVTAP
jgi:hypothetical protein